MLLFCRLATGLLAIDQQTFILRSMVDYVCTACHMQYVESPAGSVDHFQVAIGIDFV